MENINSILHIDALINKPYIGRRRTDSFCYAVVQQILASLRRFFMDPKIFIGIMILIALLLTFFIGVICYYSSGGITFIKAVVLLCYLPLFFNNGWMLLHMLYYPFVKLNPLKETFLDEIPKTAIVFFIRKESAGLYERMDYTFGNNMLPNVDLWIASGEAPKEYIDYELSVFKRLKAKFGENRIFRLHSDDPKNKKREMMEMWLELFTGRYKYFIPCDGDSLLPKNSVLRLLRKAEHPENKRIGCFQANILVASAYTHFANNNRKAVAILMELYLKIKQAIFKETLSFGHNCLVRCKEMLHLNIPEGVMSHDIFDTVYMRERGYKTVFCHDIITYEESPANYIEERKRNIRWMKGDFESARILFEKGVCFEMWFMVYFNLHLYLSSVCFFMSFNLGLFSNFGVNIWWRTLLLIQYFLTYGILFVTIFHHFILTRTLNDLREILSEMVFSTLIAANSTLYNIIDMILVTLEKQKWGLWDPMAKDPKEGLSWQRCVRCLWPSLVAGIIWLFILLSRGWVRTLLWASPILISYIFAIPLVYFTSKEMKTRRAGSSLSIHKAHTQ